jgi:tellurium resistance protein TerD
MTMGVSLTKGGNVSLTKEAGEAGLTKLTVGLGWDARVTDGAKFDLDASAFLAGSNGKVRSDSDFVFYGNKKSACGSVESLGDNLTGGGDGDDESVKVDLAKVPSDVQKVVFAVTIHKAEELKLNFGMVSNAFIRVINDADGKELTRFDLGEDFSTETAVIFGELYRNNTDWKFKAIGQGFAGGLGPLATNFGVNIG